MIARLLVSALLVGQLTATPAVAAEILRARLREAIASGADYAGNVLLDASGQSRCDYDILTSQWSPYEPAWHTGQIILALVDAYQITKDPRHLAKAKLAADWWVGLEIMDHPKLTGMVRAIHGAGIDNIVFATVSDGTTGLFALWRLTGDERYAAVPTHAGEWMLRNRYPLNHPDPNLAGGFFNVRAGSGSGPVKLVHRDIGTAFGLRFLAAYYQHLFGGQAP
jgi:hypothetical protein